MIPALDRLLSLGLTTVDGGDKAALFLKGPTSSRTWRRQLFTSSAREIVESTYHPQSALTFEQCAFVGKVGLDGLALIEPGKIDLEGVWPPGMAIVRGCRGGGAVMVNRHAVATIVQGWSS